MGAEQPLPPNYTVDEAVKMLPYIRSYCRDIRRAHQQTRKYARLGHRINSMVPINSARENKIQLIKELIVYRIERFQMDMLRWYEELWVMQMVMCDTQCGAIDVPVFVEEFGSVVYLCMIPETTIESLKWHSLDEDCDKARQFGWVPFTKTDSSRTVSPRA